MADKISLATLALAKAYTDESIEGAGAIKGKNCQIQSITNIEGGHRITFAWYNESEVLLTDTLDVMDGEDGAKGDTGNGIVKIEKTATSGLTDTYTITFTDGTTFDYDVVNGADSAVLSVNGKTGNVTLSTKDLVNDSGFIQNTVNNLVNYYLKSQIYTKTEVEDIVSAISTLSLNPVEQLPTTDISTTTIYLIPSSTQGVMDQYINLDGTTTGWVKIGDTSIDLTNYVTRSDLTLALADYVTESELSTYVVDANYVHTDNNYTDTDKAIVGGVTSALALKADKSEIPENTSDLTNDSGFITNTVNNLANYYLKSQTYTQAEVDALIAAVKNGRFISVATLPTTDIDTKAIYLVPSADPQTTNIKDEYINIDGTSAGWELIGSTAIDLSGYVTDAELTTALADYTTTANLTTLLAAKQDTISDLATIRSGASAGASAYQKPATGIPKTDLASAVQTSLEKADTAVQDISGKADKVTNAANGNFAGLDSNGNLTDSGKKASDFMASNGVEANPTGTATGTLTSLGINGDKYEIPGGGGALSLADLTDVNISNPTDGQVLQYDVTSQKWKNEDNIKPLVYGFHINGNESDPSAMVTYLEDAVGATPAHMDYTNDVFNYGSWENAFFMPKPCMLKSDGTVAYYLKEDDYTKKADGTASDIANTAFDGNAMMEWGQGSKIWLKIVPDEHGEGASVFIANYQADEDFHDYSFHNSAGVSVDHFYTPIYNGSVISSKMRSLSGQPVSKTLTGEQEITAAKLNNPGSDEMWNTECFADRLLINMLLILVSKTVDTQTAFGQGLNASGAEAINDAFRTGVHNDKGLFYGTNSGAAATYTNAVKVFGMENWFGFQWRRIRGLILSDGAFKVKLTYGQEDGSTVTGYNTDGAGYINQDLATPSGTSGSYIVSHSFTKDGMFPKTLDGSQTTYYCDAFWYNNSGARFAFCGGDSNPEAKVGAFYLNLDNAVSFAAWNRGAALSCKPLAQG